MSDADALRAEIADLDRQIDEVRIRQGNLAGRAMAAAAQSQHDLRYEQDEWLAKVRQTTWGSEPAAAPWTTDAWANWDPGAAGNWSRLRIGGLVESRTGAALGAPVTVPFIGSGRNVVVVSEVDEDPAAGEALLKSLLLRASAGLAHQARIILLDPTRQGGAFPMARHLPGVMSSNSDVRRDLDECLSYVRRITRTYLDSSVTSFEQLDQATRMTEQFQLVVVAGFPEDYSSIDREALRMLSLSGPAAGTYIFLHLDKQRSDDSSPLENAVVVPARSHTMTVGGLEVRVDLDGYPDVDVEQQVLSRLRESVPRDTPIAWKDLHSKDPSTWWRGNSTEALVVTIGRTGGTGNLDLTFGVGHDGQPSVHGVIGAAPGSGKSELFHTLITDLTTRYGPDEVELFLVDGKFGTEFRPYQTLPHARVVSLRTTPQLARSVLHELEREMARRNALFQQVGATDLVGYRQRGHIMPRVLLIVDEYQYLFVDDRDDRASSAIAALASQGRSAGIHFLFASQTFDVNGLRDRSTVFNNVHLRVALRMSAEATAALQEFQAEGRRLIASHCDRPGKVVVNDAGGADDGNVVGRVALLDRDEKGGTTELEEIIDLVVRHASGSSSPVVLHGAAQSQLHAFGLPRALEELTTWPEPAALQAIARTDPREGGLGIRDWLSAERPVAVGLGRTQSVYGEVVVVLRRARAENLVLVADDPTIRLALLSTAVCNILLNRQPATISLHVWDRTLPETPWHRHLAMAAGRLGEQAGASIEVVLGADEVVADISALHKELQRRRALPEEQQLAQPSVVVVAELDRVPNLEQVLDDFGPELSSSGQLLVDLLGDGAPLGIHLIIGVANVRGITRLIGDGRLGHFRHRVAMQMSDDDSFSLLQSSDATRLADPDSATVAVYADVDEGARTVFVPPALELADDDGGEAVLDGLDVCSGLLARWADG